MRIIIRYKMPNWTHWNHVTVFDEAEVGRWIFTLQADGYEVQRI